MNKPLFLTTTLNERLQPPTRPLPHHLIPRHPPPLKRRNKPHRLLIARIRSDMPRPCSIGRKQETAHTAYEPEILTRVVGERDVRYSGEEVHDLWDGGVVLAAAVAVEVRGEDGVCWGGG